MKIKAQVVFDIGADKFKYLQREDKKLRKVDIIDLNARLNETRKKNIYTNTKIIFLPCLDSSLGELKKSFVKFSFKRENNLFVSAELYLKVFLYSLLPSFK